VIADRGVLEDRAHEMRDKFPDDVPLPPHWGGFRVWPETVEFWQGRPSRLHDRIRYLREGERWRVERLSP
jgi:pyridoxamine 5'-phosphate oxidase